MLLSVPFWGEQVIHTSSVWSAFVACCVMVIDYRQLAPVVFLNIFGWLIIYIICYSKKQQVILIDVAMSQSRKRAGRLDSQLKEACLRRIAVLENRMINRADQSSVAAWSHHSLSLELCCYCELREPDIKWQAFEAFASICVSPSGRDFLSRCPTNTAVQVLMKNIAPRPHPFRKLFTAIKVLRSEHTTKRFRGALQQLEEVMNFRLQGSTGPLPRELNRPIGGWSNGEECLQQCGFDMSFSSTSKTTLADTLKAKILLEVAREDVQWGQETSVLTEKLRELDVGMDLADGDAARARAGAARAMCVFSSQSPFREKLCEAGAIEVLVQLLDEDNKELQVDALKCLWNLSERDSNNLILPAKEVLPNIRLWVSVRDLDGSSGGQDEELTTSLNEATIHVSFASIAEQPPAAAAAAAALGEKHLKKTFEQYGRVLAVTVAGQRAEDSLVGGRHGGGGAPRRPWALITFASEESSTRALDAYAANSLKEFVVRKVDVMEEKKSLGSTGKMIREQQRRIQAPSSSENVVAVHAATSLVAAITRRFDLVSHVAAENDLCTLLVKTGLELHHRVRGLGFGEADSASMLRSIEYHQLAPTQATQRGMARAISDWERAGHVSGSIPVASNVLDPIRIEIMTNVATALAETAFHADLRQSVVDAGAIGFIEECIEHPLHGGTQLTMELLRLTKNLLMEPFSKGYIWGDPQLARFYVDLLDYKAVGHDAYDLRGHTYKADRIFDGLTPVQRQLVHMTADCLDLDHISVGTDPHRRVCVSDPDCRRHELYETGSIVVTAVSTRHLRRVEIADVDADAVATISIKDKLGRNTRKPMVTRPSTDALEDSPGTMSWNPEETFTMNVRKSDEMLTITINLRHKSLIAGADTLVGSVALPIASLQTASEQWHTITTAIADEIEDLQEDSPVQRQSLRQSVNGYVSAGEILLRTSLRPKVRNMLVTVAVIEARGLPESISGHATFCKVELAEQGGETRVVTETNSPMWCETFVMSIMHTAKAESAIAVSCWNFGSISSLGRVEIGLSGMSVGRTDVSWHKLSRADGNQNQSEHADDAQCATVKLSINLDWMPGVEKPRAPRSQDWSRVRATSDAIGAVSFMSAQLQKRGGSSSSVAAAAAAAVMAKASRTAADLPTTLKETPHAGSTCKEHTAAVLPQEAIQSAKPQPMLEPEPEPEPEPESALASSMLNDVESVIIPQFEQQTRAQVSLVALTAESHPGSSQQHQWQRQHRQLPHTGNDHLSAGDLQHSRSSRSPSVFESEVRDALIAGGATDAKRSTFETEARPPDPLDTDGWSTSSRSCGHRQRRRPRPVPPARVNQQQHQAEALVATPPPSAARWSENGSAEGNAQPAYSPWAHSHSGSPRAGDVSRSSWHPAAAAVTAFRPRRPAAPTPETGNGPTASTAGGHGWGDHISSSSPAGTARLQSVSAGTEFASAVHGGVRQSAGAVGTAGSLPPRRPPLPTRVHSNEVYTAAATTANPLARGLDLGNRLQGGDERANTVGHWPVQPLARLNLQPAISLAAQSQAAERLGRTSSLVLSVVSDDGTTNDTNGAVLRDMADSSPASLSDISPRSEVRKKLLKSQSQRVGERGQAVDDSALMAIRLQVAIASTQSVGLSLLCH